MNISEQVCSLKQAKRLKELGVKQESLFSYFGDEATRLMDNGANPATVGAWLFIAQTKPVNNMQADHREDTETTNPISAAFTVSELGMMLSFEVESTKDGIDEAEGSIDGWACVYARGTDKNRLEFATTEAQARAAMLICLLEQNLISVTDVNARL